jgi:hypothetical protein
MAASLAKATGMQLQLAAGQHMEPLAVQLLQGSMLSQPGPWDAGILAVRVDGSSNTDGSSGSDGSGAATGSSAQPEEEAEEAGPGSPSNGEQQQDQQQQQQQQRLVVELIAAFTSPSFAIGWVGSGPQSRLQAVVLRQQGPAGGAAAAAEGAAEGGPAGRLGRQAGQPEVKCLEVCCSWPLV